MEPVGSLRPATSPYPKPDQPSPCLPSNFLKTILILSFHVRSGTLPRGSPTMPCMHLCSPPYALHAPPILDLITRIISRADYRS